MLQSRGAPISNSEVLMISSGAFAFTSPQGYGGEEERDTPPGEGPAYCKVFTDSGAS